MEFRYYSRSIRSGHSLSKSEKFQKITHQSSRKVLPSDPENQIDLGFVKTLKDFAGLLAPRKTVPRKSGPPAQPKKEKNNPSRFFDQYEQTRSSPSKSKSNLQNGSSTKLKSKGTKTKMSRYENRKFLSIKGTILSGFRF